MVVRRRRWEPVAYDRGEQERLVRTTLDAIPDRVATLRREHGDLGRESAADLEALAASGPVTGLLDDLERTLLLIKHHGFREEQEVRYAMSLYAGREHRPAVAASGIVQYRTSGYGIAPYVRVTGPDPAGGVVTPAPAPLPIRAVTISPSPHGAAGVESVQELVRAHGYDVPVGKSQIPFRA
ncbi:hypothetical protein [Agilicoccus flavus]|uniref:hypothetical protein n=1 Tax=Agilicoccus flavus TaxID=2775968 RepID=UPI001CF615D0|nr:hypothetical protein [Agilicoccus flavus]